MGVPVCCHWSSPGGFRGLPGRPLRGHQLVRHPRQEGDHHAKGHPARAKDPRRARLKRLPPQGVSFIPNFSSYDVFQEEISRPRRLLHRRNEATVTNANAPLKSQSAKRLSNGNSTDGRLRLLGSPGLEEKSGRQSVPAGNPVVAFRSGRGKSATVDGGGQPAQRWSTCSVDGVRCVLPTYITNTYPHTPHSRSYKCTFL